jgi:hypothetical protein
MVKKEIIEATGKIQGILKTKKQVILRVNFKTDGDTYKITQNNNKLKKAG